jgi:hypothetical protein
MGDCERRHRLETKSLLICAFHVFHRNLVAVPEWMGFSRLQGQIWAIRTPKKCAVIPMGCRANMARSPDTLSVNGIVPLHKTETQK